MIRSNFLSFDEMAVKHGILREKRLLEKRLIYGYQQDIVADDKRLKFLDSEEALTLQSQLVSAVEDVLFEIFPNSNHLRPLRKWRLIKRLLKVLSLNIGQDVSYRGLAVQIGADPKTVYRYLALLEEVGIIFRLESFSKGFPIEKSKGIRFYFFDCGIRNALIDNFNVMERRNDWDALWENFVIAERIKYKRLRRVRAAHFYWKTFNRQQVPLIEEEQGLINAYLLSWSET